VNFFFLGVYWKCGAYHIMAVNRCSSPDIRQHQIGHKMHSTIFGGISVLNDYTGGLREKTITQVLMV
jgi:hypothetical protein